MAQRATSLGPKLSLFTFLLFVSFLLGLFFIWSLIGKPCFSPQKGNFCLFICVSLCFSLVLFGPPPFFPFSFFVSLSFFFCSCFLPVFHFCFWFLLYLSVLFLFQDVILFLFFCLLSCFVLNHHVWFLVALHLVLFFLLFLAFVAFIFCYFLILTTNQKSSLKKMETAKKKQKWKMHKKRTFWQEQLAQVCSQIVSFFLFRVSLNFAFFAENTIKIGVSAPPQKKRKKKNTNKKKQKPSVKNWSKLALKTGPSMLRNKIGPVFSARNGSFVFVYFLLKKNPLLSAGRTRFSETKKQKKQKLGPVFNTRKGKNWTSF